MAVRQFTDVTGLAWEVFEVRRSTGRSETASQVSHGLEGGWLTFVSPGIKRRLPNYPEAWWSFDDDQLAVLCGSAHAAPTVHAAPVLDVPAATPAGARASTPVNTPANIPALDDDRIRRHANSARADGTSAVQAMIQLKRMLADVGIAPSTPAFKQARRVFVETFYFG